MHVFPKSVESKLGFDILRRRMEELTLSDLGRVRLAEMRLSGDLDWVRAELDRVSELQRVFRFDDPLPLNRVIDIRSTIRRAAPEGSLLSPEELDELRQTLLTSRRLREYFVTRRTKYERLHQVTSQIIPIPELEQWIDRIVDADGRVRDDASAELRRLRRLIIHRQAELRDKLQQELRKAIKGGHATEEQPTIRNGRMVIPVRAEAKRKIQGFVQDTSASGQTVYIEPAECLNLNNEVRELEGEERRELERILREVTSEIRNRIDDVRVGTKVLASFDLLQAKARLSNETDAVVPSLNGDGHLEIIGARNPVLQLHFRAPSSGPSSIDTETVRSEDTTTTLAKARKGDGGESSRQHREVVPLDLSLGREFTTLIITGPNAGGKTVAMKTVGMFALMISYGIPIPVDERSEFSVFDELLVDIGDEQSIEEDLSTFSSHVSNLRRMLQRASDRTLVLIDEAGTGTDPAEGGALAQAVLEELTRLGARTIVTTHHGTLKVFAYETAGVENGSMQFDQSTLSPTYRFQSGIPGSSYAFEIARRIGLDGNILERAREFAGAKQTALEDLITTFESKTQELDARLAAAEEETRQAIHERKQFQRRSDKLRREREEIRRQALEEAERIVASANARLEQTIREIRESEAERETTRAARQDLERFRTEVQNQLATESLPEGDDVLSRDESARPEPETPPVGTHGHGPARGPISVGDQVVLDDGSTAADVLEIDGEEAVISLGSVRLRTDVSRLRKVGARRSQQVRVGRIEQSGGGLTSLSARTRVDLRGFRVDEAIDAVMRLLDDALMADLDRVEILHGTGTGALRQAIHEYLAERKDVKTFDEAPLDQGGAGVTRVRLN